MGKDTHALSGPAQRTALEVLAANGVETIIQRERRRDADAGHLARHPGLQPRPQGAPRRRHRHHAVAQSARGRRLQVQPDQRRPGRHRRDQLGPGPRQRTAAADNAGVKRVPFAAAIKADDHASGRFRPAVRPRPAECHRMDAIRAAGLKLGVDPLGGASRAITGSRSTPSTGWTSTSSIRRSIRLSRS